MSDKINDAMQYAALKRWKDNPANVQVIDYFRTRNDCQRYISKQAKNDDLYAWEIGRYE